MTLHHGPLLIFHRRDELAALASLVNTGHRALQAYGLPASALKDQIARNVIAAYKATGPGQTDVRPLAPIGYLDQDDDTMTTTEVAQVLDLSERQTRRLASSLGAWKKAGVLHWPATAVVEYAEGRDTA